MNNEGWRSTVCQKCVDEMKAAAKRQMDCVDAFLGDMKQLRQDAQKVVRW